MTNIVEKLKECPKGTKLYSPICGECEFDCIVVSYHHNIEYEIRCITEKNCNINFDEFGRYEYDGGECLLFPSKENRDWSTFKYSKFKPFDKVLVRANKDCKWVPRFFAIIKDDVYCDTNGSWAKYCIPYEGNEHLLGTTIEPECVS